MENSQLFKNMVKLLGNVNPTEREALVLAARDLQNEVLTANELEENPNRIRDEYELRATIRMQV